jgi:hypothetical protein
MQVMCKKIAEILIFQDAFKNADAKICTFGKLNVPQV